MSIMTQSLNVVILARMISLQEPGVSHVSTQLLTYLSIIVFIIWVVSTNQLSLAREIHAGKREIHFKGDGQ